MSRFLTFTLFLATYLAMPVWAATQCPHHFTAGQAPVVVNPKLKPRAQELCFRAFAVLHSGIARTPLYAAEHLTRQNMKNASQLSYKGSFHAEDALSERDRAELEDYRHSGYDRGHIASNFDFATRKTQAESFSLSNVVPQVHENNVGVWAGIEGAARQMAKDEGEIYVLSGPAFIAAT